MNVRQHGREHELDNIAKDGCAVVLLFCRKRPNASLRDAI